jgi:hypothetical protein
MMEGVAMLLWNRLSRPLRRRRREEYLQAAANWPTTTARLLKSELVARDELAEGSAAQDQQVECPYYFSLEAGFFGGHLRSVRCSDSEGRRLQRQIVEGSPVTVRYDPADPDRTCVFPGDNEGTLPFTVWPG